MRSFVFSKTNFIEFFFFTSFSFSIPEIRNLSKVFAAYLATFLYVVIFQQIRFCGTGNLLLINICGVCLPLYIRSFMRLFVES